MIRDAYEAIVLTAFFYLLLMYISPDPEQQRRVFLKQGLSRHADEVAQRKGEKVARWVFPLRFVKWKPSVRSLNSCTVSSQVTRYPGWVVLLAADEMGRSSVLYCSANVRALA